MRNKQTKLQQILLKKTFLFSTAISLGALWLLMLGLNDSVTEAPAVVTADPTAICVNVFRDYNSNGVDDGNGEPAISTVTVTAYDINNNPTAFTVASDGSYTFTPGNTDTYRIEVTGLGNVLEPSAGGTTTTFFASVNTVVDVGLHVPAEYFPDVSDVFLMIPCYVDGASTGANANLDVMVAVPANSLTSGDGNVTPTEYFVASHQEIGATFGVAYSRAANALFASAFAKRHTAFGPAGTGAIYRIDLNGTEPTAPITSTGVSTLIDLNALFGANTAGANPHPDAGTNFDIDPATYAEVGKIGLGGLAYDEANNTLWTINLADRKLYEMPLGGTRDNPTSPTAGDISSWPAGGDLTDLTGLPGSELEKEQNIRPFAVKYHRGNIYVGLVATAASTVRVGAGDELEDAGDRSQMQGFVYKFDPVADLFTQVLSFPFDYPRGQGADFCSNNGQAEFNPWVDIFDADDFLTITQGTSSGGATFPPERVYPQPWITDLEFDEQGRLIVGVRDRFADQHGYNQLPPNAGLIPTANNNENTSFTADGAGDILVASLNVTDMTTYVLESNSSNGPNGEPFGPTLGINNQEGPGGGEFYFDDRYRPSNASADGDFPGCGDVNDQDPLLDPDREQGHDEISLGGIFNYNGQLELIFSAYDPINNFNNFNNSGLVSLSNLDGSRTGGNQIYATSPTNDATFAKGNGLGDVEGLTGPAPIQIGNRVWLDEDGNGRQDPGEPGLNGVTVELYKDIGGTFTLVATTITVADPVNGDGTYTFSNTDDVNQTWTNGQTEVLPEMDYEIRVPLGNVQAVNADVTAFTTPGTDMTNDNKTDLNDSDADDVGTIAFTTGLAGENNPTLDIGALLACELTATVTFSCTNVGNDEDETNDEYTVTFTVEAVSPGPLGQYNLTAGGAASGPYDYDTEYMITLAADDSSPELVFTDADDTGCTATENIGPLTPCSGATPPVPCVEAEGTIGGTTFLDSDNDGAKVGNESQAGVVVRVYNCLGEQVGFTTTGADGMWSIPGLLPSTDTFRVEFSLPTDGSLDNLKPSYAGVDNGTNVQYVVPGSGDCTVDYGLIDPNQYCNENPLVAVVCFPRNSDGGGEPVIVFVETDEARDWPGPAIAGDTDGRWGIPSGSNATNYPDVAETFATKEQVETTFGLDWDQDNSRLYSGSYMRAYASMGTNGSSNGFAEAAIYEIPIDLEAASSGTPEIWLDFETLFGDDFAGTYIPDGTFPGPTAYGRNGDNPNLIGYTGLGSIKVATDNSELYVVNLATREVLVVPIGENGAAPTAAADIKRFPIPDAPCSGTFPDGRPLSAVLGLGVHPESGRVYATMTCTGPTLDDVTGYVYSFDPADATPAVTDFALELTIPLNIDRPASSPNSSRFWGQIDHAWETLAPNAVTYNNDPTIGGSIFNPLPNEFTSHHIQPWLSEVGFALQPDGTYGMVVGERNRYHDAIASSFYVVGGVLFRACGEEGSWMLESGGVCGDATSSVAYTMSGTRAGSYVSDQNQFFYYVGREGTMGAGTVDVPLGTSEVVIPAMDNLFNSSTSGLSWLSTEDGGRLRDVRILGDYTPGEFNNTNFTKANNWGAITALCADLPIQIGNYVWIDTNEDGVQNSCEPPVTDLPVTLYTKDDDGTLTEVANTTTDAVTGEYYFDDVLQDTSYVIAFGAITDPDGNILIDGIPYTVTTDSIGQAPNNSLNDSDGAIVDLGDDGIFPAICYNTADTTDHTLDVGLKPADVFDLALVKTLAPAPAPPYAPGSMVSFLIEVSNQGNVDAVNVEVTDYVPAGLIFVPGADFTNLTPVTTIASLPAGTTETLTINFTVDPTTFASRVVNYAEITDFDDDGDSLTPRPDDQDSTPGDNQGDDEEGTDDDIDDEGIGTPGMTDNPDDADDYDPAPLTIEQPPCDLSITDVTVNCTDNTTFTVDFTVNYDYEDAVGQMIDVTIDGTSVGTITPASEVGSQSFTGISVDGPAECLFIEAAFNLNSSCTASTPLALIACSDPCTDGLGGTVFEDLNNDGTDDPTDLDQPNVLVEIYECDSDIPIATTYTNANGEWSVDDTNITYPVRVEFSTPLQPELQPSTSGADNGTNVQFVDEASCLIGYGVLDPGAVCSDNPRIVAPCYIGGTAEAQGTGEVLVDFNYDGSGAIRTVATGNQIGATWGVAYSATDQVLYVSEVVRRHSGTASTNQNVVYAIDYSGTTPAAPETFITLSGVGGLPRSLAANQNDDPAAFVGAGTAGIGDIDLSADGNTLYVTNLDEARVDIIDVPTATVTGSITFPSLDGCTLRPWALKVKDGNVFAGAVCEDALRAYVFQAKSGEDNFSVIDLNTADPAADFFDLSYSRESVWALDPNFAGAGDCNADELIPIATQWNLWTSTFPTPICVSPFGDADDYIIFPQAILSDIEFDEDGSIILGFLDRTGLQGGFQQPDPDGNGQFVTIAGGDIIRICATDAGFAPEGTTGCPQNDTGDDAYQPQGTATNPPNAALDDGTEWYNGDDWLNGSGNGEHYETAIGGLALLPGSGEVATSVYDPINGTFNAGGVRWLSNTDGESVRGLQLYQIGDDPNTFAKAAGIGDLELICAPVAIQIGNYVWIDLDEDGVQDACEEPVTGLPVTLYTKGNDGTLTQVGTTTTDATTGEYYFDDVMPDTTYLIVFGDAATAPTDTTILVDGIEYTVTVDSTGEGTNPNLNDSDAVLTDVEGTTLPAICYRTADTTDHNLDVGLVPVALLSLGSTVFEDFDNNALQEGDEPGIAGVEIQVYRVVGAKDDDTNGETDDEPLTLGSDGDLQTPDDGLPLMTDENGNYLATGLIPGDYYVVIAADQFADGEALNELPYSSTDIVTSAADNQTDGDDNGLQPDGAATDVCSPVINLSPGDEPVDGTGPMTEFAQGDTLDNRDPLVDADGDMTVDFGFFRPVSIGSTVFEDEENNGIQDGDDAGIAEVELQLYMVVGAKDDDTNGETDDMLLDAGSDGDILTPTDGLPTLTDGEGNYLFDGLAPGSYYVVVPATEFATGETLEFLKVSSTDIATSAADNQEDGDDNGLQPDGPATVVCSPVIELTVGEEPLTNDPLTPEDEQGNLQDDATASKDASGDMTVDMGFFAPVCVGDTAFIDVDMNGFQSIGDEPLPGVTVTLYDSETMMPYVGNDVNGDPVVDQLTGADGEYKFSELPPGDYYVVFDISTIDNADLYDFTTPNVGDDDLDSDAMPEDPADDTAPSGQTGLLASGEEDLTLDVGVVCAIEVTTAEPFTICSTGTIDLLTGASVTPERLGGFWTTPDGTGTFLDAAGEPITTEPYELGVAASYVPSAEDALRGSVTLILTSNDPGALEPPSSCDPVSSVPLEITILKVDCGSLFWDGSNDDDDN